MDHTWVKQVFIPVEASLDSDGKVAVDIDQELQEECMMNNVAFGCVACGVALCSHTVNTPCILVLDTQTADSKQKP